MRNFILGPKVLLLLLLLVPRVADAALVVFTHGGFMEVDSYRVEGEKIHLKLPSGGEIEMSMFQIESILEEESGDPGAEPEPPPFNPRYVKGQGMPDVPYSMLIYDSSLRWELNPRLVAAVVRAESNFNPLAVSPKGAQGLMQLMPATARQYGLTGEDVFDPQQNIDTGARHLAYLAGHFENRLDLLLAAYNSGFGTVRRHGGVPPYRETHNYLRRIYAELGIEEAKLPGKSP